MGCLLQVTQGPNVRQGLKNKYFGSLDLPLKTKKWELQRLDARCYEKKEYIL